MLRRLLGKGNKKKSNDSRLQLISIHVPKTAGTSFYKILKEIYGDQCYPSIRKRDVEKVFASIGQGAQNDISVIHGHFSYAELKSIADPEVQKVIVWLRDPIDLLVSGYNFFKMRLEHPERNQKQFELDKHRKDEDFMTFCRIKENRNIISKQLKGLALDRLFFIGFQERFEQDIQIIANKMEWPKVEVPFSNKGNYRKKETSYSAEEYEELKRLNSKDIELFEKALKLRGLSRENLY